MDFSHLALIIGLVAAAAAFSSIFLFKLVKHFKKGEARIRFNAVADTLDRLYVLPALWSIALGGVAAWIATRVVLSYQ